MCKVTSLAQSESRLRWRFLSSEDIPRFSSALFGETPDRARFGSAVLLDCGV